ncbi:MAG: oligosaccharide flippase family protein [Phocaeicola vulgatus]
MSVKQNYFYSLLNTISGLLFPIVTFPYVARILMADGIGQVNFYLSIINYISMFAGLGIPTYAIREIARGEEQCERDESSGSGNTSITYLSYSVGIYCSRCCSAYRSASSSQSSSFSDFKHESLFLLLLDVNGFIKGWRTLSILQ